MESASARVWGVAALVLAVSDALGARFGSCTVQGELMGFSRAGSGHCYFSLKDTQGSESLLRCAMFKRAALLLDFVPKDGQQVRLRGRVTVYGPRGELQFVVEAMQNTGTAGALMERFFRLKAQLEAEGLFASQRKRVLAPYPRCIGVITSLAGAALHDVVTALQRRAPHVSVVIYGCMVQGPEAPATIVQALQTASSRAEVDTLVLCRGGGSLEDLWAFNDEAVVRAVAASKIAVVCGVGHETDITLADFAADVRAPTPTAAAELAAPLNANCQVHLSQLAQRVHQRLMHRISTHEQRIDHLALRMSRPSQWLVHAGQRLHSLGLRWRTVALAWPEHQRYAMQRNVACLRSVMVCNLSAHKERLQGVGSRLEALDPRSVLKRGYAWLVDQNGQPLVSVGQVSQGQSLQAVLADGEMDLRVDAVHSKDVLQDAL